MVRRGITAVACAALPIVSLAGCAVVAGIEDPYVAHDAGGRDASIDDARAAIDAADATDGAPDVGAIVDGAALDAQDAVVAGSEIGDPGYEQQTAAAGGPLVAPWSGEGPATIGVDDTNGRNGTKCAYIYDSGLGARSNVVQTIAVAPNTTYTLTAWLQTQAPSDGPFPGGSLGVRATDGTLLAQQPYAVLIDYAQVTVTFDSGPASSVVIFAGLTSVTGQQAWIHVDDWTMSP